MAPPARRAGWLHAAGRVPRRAKAQPVVSPGLSGKREAAAGGVSARAGGAGLDNHRQLERGNGYALARLLELLPGTALLAPQCPPAEAFWSPGEGPSRTGQLVMELVVSLPVDRSRIYLVGVSMGGHGVWDLGWRYPATFAALVPVCGAAPIQRVGLLARTPIWCLHGANDREVPVEGSRRIVHALQQEGGAVHFTELPEVGHSCTRPVFEREDWIHWMFAQSRA